MTREGGTSGSAPSNGWNAPRGHASGRENIMSDSATQKVLTPLEIAEDRIQRMEMGASFLIKQLTNCRDIFTSMKQPNTAKAIDEGIAAYRKIIPE